MAIRRLGLSLRCYQWRTAGLQAESPANLARIAELLKKHPDHEKRWAAKVTANFVPRISATSTWQLPSGGSCPQDIASPMFWKSFLLVAAVKSAEGERAPRNCPSL